MGQYLAQTEVDIVEIEHVVIETEENAIPSMQAVDHRRGGMQKIFPGLRVCGVRVSESGRVVSPGESRLAESGLEPSEDRTHGRGCQSRDAGFDKLRGPLIIIRSPHEIQPGRLAENILEVE